MHRDHRSAAFRGARPGCAGTTAEQQSARYEANERLARTAIDEGDRQLKTKHYYEAVQQYQFAADKLPAAPITQSLRNRAIAGLGEASVRLAEQRITEGRYEDATRLATTVLEPQYYPNYKPAVELLAHMEDPDWFNKTPGPVFEDKVHQVQRLFIEARGFYDSARFDLALKRYDQILGLDPYNISARKGQEMVLAAKTRYANEAYNETRSLLNWQVTKEWETPPRKYINRDLVRIETTSNTNNTEYIQNKLNRIIIPQLKFSDAKVADAIAFLHTKSVELDTVETDPNKKGINFFLKLPITSTFGAVPPPADAAGGVPPGGVVPVPGVVATAPAAPASLGDKKITLSLTNIPMAEALRYICELGGLKYKVEAFAVTVVPLSEPTTQLVTKEYKVPPGFLSTHKADRIHRF